MEALVENRQDKSNVKCDVKRYKNNPIAENCKYGKYFYIFYNLIKI
jgi:hypothetical protein